MNFIAKLRYRKITKAVLLIYMCAGLLILYGGMKFNSYPKRCTACHSMKPEYFTWQASSHGKAYVTCVSCHSPPGIKGFVRNKLKGFRELYYSVTDSYVAPIRMLETIPDDSCERCHALNKLTAVPKGEIIVAHNTHKKQGVRCVKCHRGIAHGNIADRKVTYQSDYLKWDEVFGKTLMGNTSFTRPDMEDCIRCHQLRKLSIACKVCHKNSMLPAGHNSNDFKYKSHGRLAAKNLRYCDSCHSYLSRQQISGLTEPEKFIQFLEQEKKKNPAISVVNYARTNTHCKTCHGKRPPSHKGGDFIEKHGLLAKQDQNSCATCHNDQTQQGPNGTQLTQISAEELVTKTTCGSCHPSIHANSVQWKKGYHPIPLPAKPKITKSCYVCHTEETCGACHGRLK